VSLGIGEPTLKYHPSCTGILIPKGETLRAEGTFESLRYSFGGDHPSQTTHQAMSPLWGLEFQYKKGG